MPPYPKPFFRKPRGLWYVQVAGKQPNLGPDREAAFCYPELMAKPATVPVPARTGDAVAVLCDRFLEWVQRHRSAATYEWYRYRLQRFVERYPDLTADELRPYHVEQWVDGYTLAQTSRRNYFRSVKRCLHWAVRQGYLAANPIANLEVPSGERKGDWDWSGR